MECLFFPKLEKNNKPFSLNPDEQKHLKVLRVQENEHILITNGLGLSALCKVNYGNKWQAILSPLEYFDNFGELPVGISLLCCKISDRDRLEFLIEKSTEFGVEHFFIVNCKYSQPGNININRLESKAISAMKQSKRSVLPQFSILNGIIENPNLFNEFDKIILLDENGMKAYDSMLNKNFDNEIKIKFLIVVGPEGGLHNEELEFFFDAKFSNKLIKWNLGNRRLRTETAAIKGISLLTSVYD